MNVLRLKVIKRREKRYFYLNNRSMIRVRMIQMVESREITLWEENEGRTMWQSQEHFQERGRRFEKALTSHGRHLVRRERWSGWEAGGGRGEEDVVKSLVPALPPLCSSNTCMLSESSSWVFQYTEHLSKTWIAL